MAEDKVRMPASLSTGETVAQHYGAFVTLDEPEGLFKGFVGCVTITISKKNYSHIATAELLDAARQ
jgi:hypothetical protein